MEQTQRTTPIEIKARIDKMLDGAGAAKAFASATIAGAFAVHGIRVIEKDDGSIQVAMPFRSYKSNGETKFCDTFHAITADARTALIDAVKGAYVQTLAQRMSEPEHEGPAMGQQM